MPNYRYKCCKCKQYKDFSLPISTDPARLMACGCGYSMKRVMIAAQIPNTVGKVWAADWYKKTYGHELGGKDSAYASEQKALDVQAAKLFKEEGIKIKTSSREARRPE